MAYFKELDTLLFEKYKEAKGKLTPGQQTVVQGSGCGIVAVDAAIQGALAPKYYDIFYRECEAVTSLAWLIHTAQGVADIFGAQPGIYHAAKLEGVGDEQRKLSHREAEEMVGRLRERSLAVWLGEVMPTGDGHVSTLLCEYTGNHFADKIIHIDPNKGSGLLTPRQAACLIRRVQVKGCVIELKI